MEPKKGPATFVATIDLSLAGKLKENLLSQGFTLTTPPYTLFSGKKGHVSCTLYTSGKLTVQGKDKDEFISFYLEPEILGTLAYSHPELSVNFAPRIGIDEAGKGDLYGPLCIAGVYADEQGIKTLLDMGVADSKTLSDPKIAKLAREIRSHFPHAIISLFPTKYNELYEKFQNLNRMLAWAHATAIAELVEKTGCKEAYIDQFAAEHLVENALKKKCEGVHLTQRHHGEEDPVVAAASLLARAAFVDGIASLGRMVEIELPKGANSQVIQVGKALVRAKGKEILGTVAKLHFKTIQTILDA